MSEIKLLPCPFCGGKAEIREIDYDPEWHPTYNDPDSGGDAPVYVIICKSCEASIKYKYKESEAIQSWNNRKPIDDMVKQIHSYFKSVIDKSDSDNVPLEVLEYNKAICDIVCGGRE